MDKHKEPPHMARETATDDRREVRHAGVNRADRRRLNAIDRELTSLDKQIERAEKAEGKKP